MFLCGTFALFSEMLISESLSSVLELVTQLKAALPHLASIGYDDACHAVNKAKAWFLFGHIISYIDRFHSGNHKRRRCHVELNADRHDFLFRSHVVSLSTAVERDLFVSCLSNSGFVRRTCVVSGITFSKRWHLYSVTFGDGVLLTASPMCVALHMLSTSALPILVAVKSVAGVVRKLSITSEAERANLESAIAVVKAKTPGLLERAVHLNSGTFAKGSRVYAVQDIQCAMRSALRDAIETASSFPMTLTMRVSRSTEELEHFWKPLNKMKHTFRYSSEESFAFLLLRSFHMLNHNRWSAPWR